MKILCHAIWMMSLLVAAMTMPTIAQADPAEEQPKQPEASAPAIAPTDNMPKITGKPIRVALYDHSEKLDGGGPKNLLKFLTEQNGFEARRVTPQEIRDGVLKDFDVLVMPGGSGKKEATMLEDAGKEEVRKFVKNGGGYMGICAGAYLASANYPWSLHLINAKILDTQHWARGTGMIVLDVNATGQQALNYSQEKADVYYGQGPLLTPGDSTDLPAYEPLATYATEIAKNGAPAGVMIGATAIARAPYGDGRVILFSPHPEKPGGLNFLIANGVTWAAHRSDK